MNKIGVDAAMQFMEQQVRASKSLANMQSIIHMEEENPVSEIVTEEQTETDYSGAPVTPRGKNGQIEGDWTEVIDNMPLPTEQFFVVVPICKPGPKEVVLRPAEGCTWTVFPNRDNARLVAESQCRNNPDFGFGVYGPFESEKIIETEPWNHPRSTPCDTYEMLEVTVRREYFPRGHKRQGQLKQEVKEKVCNHVDFGFVTPSKNVIEDPSAIFISGSMLTSYLTTDGDLIHPNVALMAKPPSKEHMSDDEYGKMFQQVLSNQKDAIDKMIDEQFRKALPKLYPHNPIADIVVPFQIIGNKGNGDEVLFEGQQPVPANKLPFAFAKILRTALTSWYGYVTSINLNLGNIIAFPMIFEDN